MSKKEKEILVRAPIFIRIGYERPEVTAMAERLNFFSICGRISKYSAGPIMVASLLLFLFTAYGLLNPAQFSFPKPLFIYAVVSMGIMNILSGLLLLAKE